MRKRRLSKALAMFLAAALTIPAAVPVGCGILRGASSAVPSGCGVILYFFMKLVKDRATVLQGNETEPLQKLQLLLDGVLKNEEMWLTVVVFASSCCDCKCHQQSRLLTMHGELPLLQVELCMF